MIMVKKTEPEIETLYTLKGGHFVPARGVIKGRRFVPNPDQKVDHHG
jgi:hypothetical protein